MCATVVTGFPSVLVMVVTLVPSAMRMVSLLMAMIGGCWESILMVC